jgi:hypothetical protein
VPVVVATALGDAEGGVATAAALAVSLALLDDGRADRGGVPVLFAGIGAGRGRGPTMLAADGARMLESRLREGGFDAAARGRLACLRIDERDGWRDRLREALALADSARVAVVHLPGRLWRCALEGGVEPRAALLRADLPAQRSLAALSVAELRAAGLRVRIARRPPGRVGSRRALAGLEPGGEASRRAKRLARGLVGEAGQALPLVLGGVFLLAFGALLLSAFGGAVTGKARAQRLADLAALSSARSMRDDFERLFVGPRLPDGSPNPRHLSKAEYLRRATVAAAEAARRNSADPERVRIRFPDAHSFAPLRVRARLHAELEPPADREADVKVVAEAEVVPPAAVATPAPEIASGGGYSGPLAYRQGKPMRPDVAAAFDRLAAAGAAAGHSLVINSAFRSDAEQAALFAQNPDPQWVAPPGQSLHRCATELDLGPPAAYGWVAANASRFGFLKRYAWEPWHFGYTDGPPPCSAAGDVVGAGGPGTVGGDGAASAATLPDYVPAEHRAEILDSAARWDVSAALLSAQLMAESNFNPFAVSPAGAQGIAQFMPGTAAAYGLDDPFDPAASIDAQAHLMSDLLGQFGGSVPLALAAYNAGPAPVAACGCVPPYPETQAYVARILGLMEGAGELTVPELEVRLVE